MKATQSSSSRKRQSSRDGAWRIGHGLDDLRVPDGRATLPLHRDPVERVARRLAVELEEDGVLRPRSFPPLGRVGEVAVLPPGLGAREHARRLEADAVVDRRHERLRVLQRDQASCSPLGRTADAVRCGYAAARSRRPWRRARSRSGRRSSPRRPRASRSARHAAGCPRAARASSRSGRRGGGASEGRRRR